MWFVFTILTTLIWGFVEIFYNNGTISDEKYAHLKTLCFVGIVWVCLQYLFYLLNIVVKRKIIRKQYRFIIMVLVGIVSLAIIEGE